MAAGLLIILNFLCLGVLFLLFFRLRELAKAQLDLAERVGIVEEMMLELSADEEVLESVRYDGPPEAESAGGAEPDSVVLPVEEERTHRILSLAGQGMAPDEIARLSGYSIGEVQLILNLHRRVLR